MNKLSKSRRWPMFLSIVWLACLLAGCDGSSPGEWPAYKNVIPESQRVAAAEWILKTVEAANPHSDEEPEDNIAQAERTAQNLFGEPTLGMRTRRNGVWVFVPLKQLPLGKQATVNKWASSR